MARYIASVLMGDIRNRTWKPGAPLVMAPDTVLVVEARDPMLAAEAAFTVGNRMAPDADGALWSTNIRSVSVSDVVLVAEEGETGPPTALVVKPFGWEEADTLEVLVAVEGTTYDALVDLGAAREQGQIARSGEITYLPRRVEP